MFALDLREAVPITGGGPSPLLTHIAGDFAPAIAALWPAPHAVFLTAAAARRHLLCIALGAGPLTPHEGEAVLCGLFRRAIRDLLPEAPDGLGRAVARLGETAWSSDDYQLLLQCLADREAGKVLRHAEAITAAQVRTIYSLPNALVAAGGGRLGLSDDEAALLGDCFLLIARRDGDQTARAAAERWARTDSARAAFKQVAFDILPEPASPPFPGTTRLVPLATKAAVCDAATRFNNCLKTRLCSASLGEIALYEWLGEPGVAVEIVTDQHFGWRLTEGKLVGNGDVEEPTRGQIVDELRAMGVHVGRSGWDLERDVGAASCGHYTRSPLAEVIAEYFR
ncbi:hypothetical protein BH11PSE2_BH11PSE2_03970 [soil metagenome]